MDKRLWEAIQELLDAADYALGPLDNYSDYVSEPLNYGISVPNDALTAHSLLKQAIDEVEKLMPKEPTNV